MAKMKTFTLAEAQRLLPVLKSLLKRAMDSKQVIERIEKGLQDLNHRILLSGGLFVDIPKVARRRAERDKAVQAAKDAMAEVEAIGVQIKDLDMGLLDFPCVVDDQIVLLCWKYGEEKIEFWHGLEEGFRGRKPIDERIMGKKKEKPKKEPEPPSCSCGRSRSEASVSSFHSQASLFTFHRCECGLEWTEHAVMEVATGG